MDVTHLLTHLNWVGVALIVLAASIVVLLVFLMRLRENAESDRREIRNLQLMVDQMFPMVGMVDLKRNSVKMIRHRGFRDEHPEEVIPYDEFIRVGAEDVPEGEQRDQFLRTFGREQVLEAFREGKEYVELEHQHRMDDGQYHWTRGRIMRLENGEDYEDAISVGSVIDEEMASRLEKDRISAMLKGLARDYVAVYYVRPDEDRATLVSGAETEDLPLYGAHGPSAEMRVNEFARLVADSFVNPHDVEGIAHALDRESLRARFAETEGSGREVLTALRKTAKGNRYFQIKLMRINGQNNDGYGIVIGLKDSHDLIGEQMNYEKRLETQVASQGEVLQRNLERINRIQGSVIESMATLVESRDVNTGDHIRSTRTLVTMLVGRLRADGVFPVLEDENLARNIIVGSVLHDIGKIFISDVILNKRGKLTPEEFRTVKLHTSLGREIVEELFYDNLETDSADVIRDIVYCHHERWDGGGYPQGLRGEEIPLAARIMAVADVLDALISRRSYKEPFPLPVALSIIREEAGSHFDKRIVDTLLEMEPEIRGYLAQRKEGGGETTLSGAINNMVEAIQNRSVTGAFVEDYEAAVVVSPDTGKGRLLYASDEFRGLFSGKFDMDRYYDSVTSMTGRPIHPDDRAAYMEVMSAEGMKKLLTDRRSYKLNYRVHYKGLDNYHMQMRLIRIDYATGERGFDVLVGCKDVDLEVRRAQEEERQGQLFRDVIAGLSDDYEAIFHAELETDILRTVRAKDRFIVHHPGLQGIETYSAFVLHAPELVYEADRAAVERCLVPERVRELLDASESEYYVYRRMIHGELRSYQLKLIRTEKWKELGAFIIGVRAMVWRKRQETTEEKERLPVPEKD